MNIYRYCLSVAVGICAVQIFIVPTLLHGGFVKPMDFKPPITIKVQVLALYPFWQSTVAAFTEPNHASHRTPATTVISPSCASSISHDMQAAVAPNVAQCLCARIPSLPC